MRCCTPLNVIKRVKIPSSFHVTFALVNKFVCDTHLFSTLIVDHVLITLEGVKRVLFYTIPSEFDEKVVNTGFAAIALLLLSCPTAVTDSRGRKQEPVFDLSALKYCI